MPMAPECPSESSECRVTNAGAGLHTTCVSLERGDIVCFGANAHGQASPSAISASVPPSLVDQRGYQLALGDAHVCTQYGPAICWGRTDATGMVGAGPHVMSIDDGHTDSLVSGALHACWLTTETWFGDGVPPLPVLTCSGMHDSRALADPTARAPRSVPLPTGADPRGVGQLLARGFRTCVQTFDGERVELLCTGGVPPDGPLSDGAWRSDAWSPRGLEGFQLALGGTHACFVDFEQRVQCFGEDRDGALGPLATGTSDTPVWVELPAAAQEVCVSTGLAVSEELEVSRLPAHSCALLVDGSVWCWGASELGQLGSGASGSHAPREVIAGGDVGEGLAFLACGATHTCVVGSAGGLHCWGDSSHGALAGPIDERGVAHWGALPSGNDDEPPRP